MFSPGRGKSSSRGSKVFRPTPGDEGIKTLPPTDSSSLTQSTSRSSPFFQIRLANKSCHSFQSKSSQTPDPVRIQGPSKTKSWPLYPVSSVKERNRKGGKCKISRVLQSPVPSTKPHLRWRPVIDLNRLNTFLHVEKFKMETPESIRTSLIPGEWVSLIDLSDTYLHIPIHPNSRKYLRFCYKSLVFQFTSLPFGLATAPQVFTMIVKEVKLMALSRGLRIHQHLDDWLIRSQSQEEAQVNTQAVVDLTQSLGWIINQKKKKKKKKNQN